MKKIGMISLGCPKNQVDGELMLAKLADAGYEIVNRIEGADCVIVNTCGFIDDAKREAIENILEVAQLKEAGLVGKLVVTGCLAQRYKDEVLQEMPEIDGIAGIGSNADIVSLVENVIGGNSVSSFKSEYCLPLSGDRLLSTPSHWAYLKIAEGCSNKCTYCAIPSIRGGFRSRKTEDIIAEAESLAAGGVKEIIIIAQDVTKYGVDLYGEYKLAELLKELSKIEELRRIRLLYCYPDALTDELIDTIAAEEKICNYIDLPLQHANASVLKRMGRSGNGEEYVELIEKIRRKIPGVTLRSTMIAGFPGETEEEFNELCDFVEKAQFDRLGCFAYSAEDGTPAARMKNQLDEDTKRNRAEIINSLQAQIFEKKQEEKIGQRLEIIVDRFDENDLLYYGRTEGDCPEIDGEVIISTENELTPGSFVSTEIIGTDAGDLVGEIAE